MQIKQLSVVLENLPGKLSKLSDILGGEGINIRAISVADTSDLTTVRMVVDDPGQVHLPIMEMIDKKRGDHPHVARQAHEVDLVALEPVDDLLLVVHFLVHGVQRCDDRDIG